MPKKSTFKTIHLNPTWLAMNRIDQLCDLLFTGKKIMQMFCSDPGMGKTERVLRSMKKHGIEPHYSSPTNPSAFCNDLWKHRNSPFFLDDVDHLARSEPCANIAKGAFGSLRRRVVVPVTNIIMKNEEYRLMGHPNNGDQPHPRYRTNIPPPEFFLGPRSCLPWNTNKNFSDPNVIASDMQADFAALVSKGLDPLWIPNEPQDVFDFTLHMVVAEGMLRGHPIGSDGSKGGFSASVVNEVVAFFCTNAARLKEISPRAIIRLALARRVDPNYLAAWEATLLPKPKWQLDIPEMPRIESRKVPVTATVPDVDGGDDQYEAVVDDAAAEWFRIWLSSDQIEIPKTDAPSSKGKRGGARPGAGRPKKIKPNGQDHAPTEDMTSRELADLVNAAAAKAREKGLSCQVVVDEFAPIYARVVHKGLKGKQEFADAAYFMANNRFYSIGAFPKIPYVSDCVFFWDAENYVSRESDEMVIKPRQVPAFPEDED